MAIPVRFRDGIFKYVFIDYNKLLLMAEILHQLRLVAFSHYLDTRFHTSQVVVWEFLLSTVSQDSRILLECHVLLLLSWWFATRRDLDSIRAGDVSHCFFRTLNWRYFMWVGDETSQPKNLLGTLKKHPRFLNGLNWQNGDFHWSLWDFPAGFLALRLWKHLLPKQPHLLSPNGASSASASNR